MTEIAPFTFPATGHAVRTLLVDGSDPWFVAADVTAALGYSNGRDAVSRCVSAGQKGVSVVPTPSGEQTMTILSEAGVYRLIMRSNLPQAVAFQDWLAEEVIPSIRRTGSYAGAPPSELEVAQRYLAALEREQGLVERVEQLAPAAEAWNTLGTSTDDYDVTHAAQILSRDPRIEIGRQRLFVYLASIGWTYRRDDRWCAYQAQVDNGRLRVLPQSHRHHRTRELVLDAPQIRVTIKGLLELHKRLGGSAALAELQGAAA